MMCSTTAFSASGDIQYATAVKAYKSRCQQGDYINAKFEELKDIEQINILAQKFGKPPFVSACKNQQEKPQAGKVEQSVSSASTQTQPNIPVGDTYENVDARYLAELSIYSRKCLRGDYSTYKDEWSRDKSRINELAKQLNKPKFEPSSEFSCDTLLYSRNANSSNNKSGSTVPNGSGRYKPAPLADANQKLHQPNVYVDDLDKYSSGSYEPSNTKNDYANLEFSELQHEQRLVDFDGLTSALPDCPVYGIKDNCFGRDGEPGDGYLGEFKNNLRDGFGAFASKDKNLMVVGYFKDGALQGRVRYSPINNLSDVHQGVFINGQFIEQQSPQAGPTLMQRLGNAANNYLEQERRNKGITCTKSFDDRSMNCK